MACKRTAKMRVPLLLSPCPVAAALLIAWLSAAPRVAFAYTIKNELSAGCHEEITTAAAGSDARHDPAPVGS